MENGGLETGASGAGEHLIVSPQISTEIKRLMTSIEIQAGNREGF